MVPTIAALPAVPPLNWRPVGSTPFSAMVGVGEPVLWIKKFVVAPMVTAALAEEEKAAGVPE